MIVAITGPRVSVSVDDGIDAYCPTRSAELVRHCVVLYLSSLSEVDDAVVEE